MINSPNPSNGCDYHKVVDAYIDPSTGTVEIVIGSWPMTEEPGRPPVTTILRVKYDQWLPEYYFEFDQVINSHPSWTGVGPTMPNEYCYWNVPTAQWVDIRPLQALKDAKWDTIKIARAQANTAPLSTPYGTFDANIVSQKSITDAILLLQTLEQLGTPTTIDFTLTNNTTVTLTTQQMVNVGLLLGQRTQEVYATGRALRAQIDAATTVAEVEAITWPTT